MPSSKIIKKSFGLNMSTDKNALQKFLNFCAAHLPVRYRDEIPVFLIFDMFVNN